MAEYKKSIPRTENMEDWLRKCLDCYHCYTAINDDTEVRCKRADKGKDCRFYSEEEHHNRVKKKKMIFRKNK